jgi:hypothetical protein
MNDILEPVNAQEIPGLACCEKTKDGNSCQYALESECDPNYRKSPTTCENTNDFGCEPGCCISPNTGLCNIATPKKDCTNANWKESQFCNVPECQYYCCILGNQVVWTSEKNCEILSRSFDLIININKTINSEIECLFSFKNKKQGACVLDLNESKKCIYTTKEDCTIKTNNKASFYEDFFCSDPKLNTGCNPKFKIGCIENKDDVYWFDSCGNSEEVYEDCDFLKGTMCKNNPIGTINYTCSGLSCVTKSGEIRKNGESWCEYDGIIGDGNDVPGSRHIRHMCIMGEEKIEPCEDYRNQICVEQDYDLGNSEKFSESACRINSWRTCFEYNTHDNSETMSQKCNDNSDCFIKEVILSNDFHFNFCSPKYPPGFDFEGSYAKSAEAICSIGSIDCKYLKQKTLLSFFHIQEPKEINRECKSKEFAEKLNDFCRTLGDCGADVNYNGKTTTGGYAVINTEKLTESYIDNLKSYSIKNKNQKKASPGNINTMLGIPENLGEANLNDKINDFNKALIGVSGSLGGLAILQSLTGGTIISELTLGSLSLNTVISAGFFNAISAGFASFTVGLVTAKLFGLDEQTAIASSILGFPISYILYYLTPFDITKTTIATVIILAAFQWLLKELGFGEIKEQLISFKCYPWQPPKGGEHCNECNNNEIPCSEYRCKSLGQTCELLNKGTSSEICANVPDNDVTSPKIMPLIGFITQGYEYANINNDITTNPGFELIKTGNDKCIDAFTPLDFAIKTIDNTGKDKPSICKIGFDPSQDYDDMDYFGSSSIYSVNHTTRLIMPDVNHLAMQYNLTEQQKSQLKEVRFYVKCQGKNNLINLYPYTIRTCVNSLSDLTGPIITKIIPEVPYVPYEGNEIEIKTYTNEPASCKWSFNQNDNYNQMTNLMNCNNSINDITKYGYLCMTNIIGISKVNNKVYLNCKDLFNNTLSNNYKYEIKITQYPLVIEELKPENNKRIFIGGNFADITLGLKLSGGVQNGFAECYWQGNGYGPDKFLEKEDGYGYYFYTYDLFGLTNGDYSILFNCKDIANNNATGKTDFNIKTDSIGPVITRAYFDNGLKIITSEKAVCKYLLNNKNNFNNATLMQGEDLEHFMAWSFGNYYIQCKDIYGNTGGLFSIKLY